MNKNPGQKHLQDMMARSQKQMANQQKRSMQMAWTQKQQEEARRLEQAGHEDMGGGGTTTKWQGQGHFQPDERFRKVEAEVASLKKQLQAGRLSEQKFNEQLNNLMVEDDKGDWWMIGTKSDAWYRFDGQNWVQSTPPGRWVQGSSAATGSKTSRAEQKSRTRRPFGAIVLFLFLLGLFAVLGYLAGWFLAEGLGMYAEILPGIPAPTVIMFIVWAFGFFFALKRARRTWRGW